MNIKAIIGQRIMEARKAKGLTQVGLAELIEGLKQPRINNWERGIRTPGLEEIKQLGAILEVSPAYLMCLTENKKPYFLDKNQINLIPLIEDNSSSDLPLYIQGAKNNELEKEVTFIPLSVEVAQIAGENAFGFKITDESMEPELHLFDVVIINRDLKPKPGNLVAAIINGNEIVIRRYKQLANSSNSAQSFELLVLNNHWPDIKNENIEIVGTVISLQRQMIATSSKLLNK